MADDTHRQWNVFSLLDVFAKKKALSQKGTEGKMFPKFLFQLWRLEKNLKNPQQNNQFTDIKNLEKKRKIEFPFTFSFLQGKKAQRRNKACI